MLNSSYCIEFELKEVNGGHFGVQNMFVQCSLLYHFYVACAFSLQLRLEVEHGKIIGSNQIEIGAKSVGLSNHIM